MALQSGLPWYCAQIGAREHYAIPRALQQQGRLAGLFTDFWAGPFTRNLPALHGTLRSLASRHHAGLDEARVTSCNLQALMWEAQLRRASREEDGRYQAFCDIGKKFAIEVARRWAHKLPSGAIFYAYDTGAREAFEAFRPRGVRCLLNQMDPGRVETEIVREEEQRWPGWALRSSQVPDAYFQRREAEWALADRVVVNSEFSRQALIRQGVPMEKVIVIPLCYEAGDLPEEGSRQRTPERPLQVLFLGQVILRKGIQYLIEAARLLRDEPVRIAVVGSIGLTEMAIQSAPSNLTFHGRASRDQTSAWYQQSDLFVLPTLSDGFALTQIEAMAHGLPVITTPNCGEVVTDGTDGRIVPPRDAQTLAEAIAGYAANRDLLREHQITARKKARQFSLAHLSANLAALER